MGTYVTDAGTAMSACASSLRFHAWVGIAVGERVEPGAEHHVLADPAGDRRCERVLGATATSDEERAQRAGETGLVAARIGADRGFRPRADDPERDRFVEHQRVV